MMRKAGAYVRIPLSWEHVLRAAGAIAGVTELVVIGSQAILAWSDSLPEGLLASVEADLYPRGFPELADLIDGSIGELSPFHETFGYFKAAGFEVTVALRGAGSILGEQALLDGQPRSATIQALTHCRLWVLTRAIFLSYLTTSPDLALPLLAALSLRLREASERIQELAHTSVRYRLARLLCTLALHDGQPGQDSTLLPPLAHENLGSLIGVKRETVTRCLAQFRTLGLVEQQGRRLYVTNLQGLQELADTLEEA